jgi:pimeloyl-ACP methyl ester carboxylesterase
MKMTSAVVGALFLIALVGCAADRTTSRKDGGGAAPRIAIEEFTVAAGDPGIDLYVRNKHPLGVSSYSGDRILLFVHGATYPGETTFDLPLNGTSWMDYIASRGYDVYFVDVRGYGRSTRPKEMEQPAESNPPMVRTETAVNDVGTAVEFIRKRRGVDRINLMGWSWGTAIMGWYTAQNNDKVEKLVLYAPQWVSQSSSSATDAGGKLGAYRSVTREPTKKRWLTGVPEVKQSGLIPPGWFDAWADATFATDPVGAQQTPPVLRAPNGIVLDSREYWRAGKPLYDPADIRVPTFLAHAEWDAELPNSMLYAYFEKLVNAPYKRYVQIGEGTHFVMMEKNRMQLFQAVQQFLDEKVQPGQ